MNPHLVVAVGGQRDVETMRWAVEEALRTGERLRVVHATSTPIAVDGFVSESISSALGDPFWATLGRRIDDLVVELGAPVSQREVVSQRELVRQQRISTVVAHAHPVDLIVRHSTTARLVVLGPSLHSRWWQRRHSIGSALERRLSCAIVRPTAPTPPAPSAADPTPPTPLGGLAMAA